MKKAISLVLSVVLLFGITAGLDFSVYAQTNPTVYSEMSSSDVNAGETVRVPISIKDNAGILGWKLTFDYDTEVLTPISVDYGEVISGGIQDNIEGDMVPGSINVYWAGSDNEDYNGVMIYINFAVNQSAVGNTVIGISFSQEDTFDNDFNDVYLNCQPISLNVVNNVYSQYAKINASADNIIAGDTLQLKLNISEITNVTGVNVTVDYNADNFDFESVSAVSGITVSNSVLGGQLILNISGITPAVNNTDFVTLTFKSKDKAMSGDYEFTVSSPDSGIICKSCTIGLSPSATSEVAEIYADDVTAEYNSEITIPIYIDNNHGIMGYRVDFKYDTALLEPISATCGADFSRNGQFNDSIGVKDGEFKVLWNNIDEKFATGVLFTLKFKVLTQAKNSTVLEMSYSQPDTFNEQYQDVVFNCKNINVTLNNDAPDLTGFKIDSASLTLQNSIKMNFRVQKSVLTGYENPYMVFSCEGFEDTTVTEYTEQDDYYVFSFPGIAANMMNNDVTATLYATYTQNGKLYSSESKALSVKGYCYKVLTLYESIDTAEINKLKALIVDLLNYGAQAQVYTTYQQESLVNADLTEAQKLLGTTVTPELVNITDKNYITISSPTASWSSATLILLDSVKVKGIFTADSVENKTVKITCANKTYTYTKDDFTDNGDGTYSVVCGEIKACQMSEEILMTVYENEAACSNTLKFSVESYAKVIQDSEYAGSNLDKLTQAMMCYGKSAEAYGAK